MMVPHLHYVEPYAGGLAVLLHRDPDDPRLWLPPHKGVSEVANDSYGALTNFWRVLQEPVAVAEFRRRVEAIPMSRAEWDDAGQQDECGDKVGRAVNFFVRCRQSRAGMMKDFTSITRSRTRRQMNGNVSEWLGAVDGLADVHARLRRVLIENMDAVDLIRREATEHTFQYLDPPYLAETRSSPKVYLFEMDQPQHVRLLETIRCVPGQIMLSGYPSELYRDMLHDWRTVEVDMPNNAAGGATKARETEVLWMNY